MSEEGKVSIGSEAVKIPADEYLKLKQTAEALAEKEAVIEDLQNTLTRLKLDASVANKGSMVEAVQLALLMSETNDFLRFLGKDPIDFSSDEITDIRLMIIQTLEAIKNDEKLDVWFGLNDDILIIIKNLKQAILAKQAVAEEEAPIVREVVKY